MTENRTHYEPRTVGALREAHWADHPAPDVLEEPEFTFPVPAEFAGSIAVLTSAN